MKTTNQKSTHQMSTLWFLAAAFTLVLAGCGGKNNNDGGNRGGYVPPGGGVGSGGGSLPPGAVAAAAVGTINTGGALAGEIILEIRVAGQYNGQVQPGTNYQGQVEATGAIRVTREDTYCGIPRGDYAISPVPGRPGTMIPGPTGSQPTIRDLNVFINGPFGPIQVNLPEFYLYAQAPAIVPFNGASYPFTMFGWMQITNPPPNPQYNTSMCRDMLSQFVICRYGQC